MCELIIFFLAVALFVPSWLPVVQSKFVEELAQQGRIRELILDQYANYVVQRALTVANNEEGLKLVNAIRPHLHSMQVWSNIAMPCCGSCKCLRVLRRTVGQCGRRVDCSWCLLLFGVTAGNPAPGFVSADLSVQEREQVRNTTTNRNQGSTCSRNKNSRSGMYIFCGCLLAMDLYQVKSFKKKLCASPRTELTKTKYEVKNNDARNKFFFFV